MSKKQHAQGKRPFKAVCPALARCPHDSDCRKELGLEGFCAVGGKTTQGKALYAKADIYAAERLSKEDQPAFVVVRGAEVLDSDCSR